MNAFNPDVARLAVIVLAVFAAAAWAIGSRIDVRQRRRQQI